MFVVREHNFKRGMKILFFGEKFIYQNVRGEKEKTMAESSLGKTGAITYSPNESMFSP